MVLISGLDFRMIQKVSAAIFFIFQPIKIFKITAYTFCIILKSSPDIKTSLPSAPSLLESVDLGENWVFFSLYGISIGFRDPDSTLSAIK